MIPHLIPNLCGNEAAYLQECVETNFVSSVGPFVTRFEEMVASAAGAASAVATSSGTTGLHAGLTALGVSAGDLVLVPALTFVATANAVSHCGARPWLIDVEPENWTLSADALRHALKNETRRDDGVLRHAKTGNRVAAIMPVFTMGAAPDLRAITEMATQYHLPVIVDAAPALGASWNGKPITSANADLYVYSFNGNKTITAGGGGAVTGNDSALLSRVRHLTTTARVGVDYEHDMVGFNYRMTNLQAAVGCAQMENLDRFITRKREIHHFYKSSFAGSASVDPFPEPLWGESAYWLSGVVLKGPAAQRRDEIRSMLRESGIDARPIWKPMHLLTPYRDTPRSEMPVCEEIWPCVLTLPSSTGITDGELETVHKTLAVALEKILQ